jgi:hypothetical protein
MAMYIPSLCARRAGSANWFELRRASKYRGRATSQRA